MDTVRQFSESRIVRRSGVFQRLPNQRVFQIGYSFSKLYADKAVASLRTPRLVVG